MVSELQISAISACFLSLSSSFSYSLNLPTISRWSFVRISSAWQEALDDPLKDECERGMCAPMKKIVEAESLTAYQLSRSVRITVAKSLTGSASNELIQYRTRYAMRICKKTYLRNRAQIRFSNTPKINDRTILPRRGAAVDAARSVEPPSR